MLEEMNDLKLLPEHLRFLLPQEMREGRVALDVRNRDTCRSE